MRSSTRTRTRTRTAVAAAAVLALALGAAPTATAHAGPAAPPAPYAADADADAPRQIPLQGAVNVRDVGGYRTYDGERVRHGRVFRADALSRLTDADVAKVAGLGLRKVVDFRVAEEVAYDGPDRLPGGLVATSRPVTDNGLFRQLMTVIGSRDPVRQEEMLGGGRAEAFMRDVYRTFVTDATDRTHFGATLRDIAAGGTATSSRALLYHCTSGKDRTGWTTYVLLRAVGVPEHTAVQDYLASNTFRAAYDAKLRETLKQTGMMQNPNLLVPLQEVRTDYLEAALTEVNQRYGSFGGYLTKGLGLDAATLVKLRRALVG
ncbi:tyrosine-protein phosphatase [Streptomyces aurantiacus]|uniref:Putative tyrosine-protein phosphatase n=1 Tax=Streptomyces aurantiacus JA 4570 TaxID=1286094 RepID=S3ZHT6_9ACTN|nr:tyrosine-protein phosphatase [Streptomyces aurantiacus]EPH42254.1 putative tyrosine-protein phosphatase [Streptomyces aurantiacus JA 4570]